MLELKNIYKSFKNKRVLEDVNLTFESKGFVAITGESGSGKTTLINIIAGIEGADSGDLIFDNKNMTFDKESERIENILKSISYMAQSQILLYDKTVYENLKEILNLYHLKDEGQINSILNQLHLNETYKNRIVSTLSTGEAQRVCIAISLLKKSNLLILDEATENLDQNNQRLILNILKEISKEKLVILVTHNTFLAKQYVDRLITISNHKVYTDEAYKNDLIPLTEEIEVEHIKGKKKQRFNLPFKNILFYVLLPLIYIFFIGQLSIWIKPNLHSEANAPLSHYQKDSINEDGNIYAEDIYFTKEEIKKIFEEANTYLIFDENYLFKESIKGYIDYDFNYDTHKKISAFDEYIVSNTFLELNPSFEEQYKVIEIIEMKKSVVIINYEMTLNHYFPNEMITYELLYQASLDRKFSRIIILTANEKKTFSLELPIINCYKKNVKDYYKSNSMGLSFGTTICTIMILLTISLYIVLANKQAPHYYKTITFYRVCGQSNLGIKKKLKMDFYVFPILFIVLCSCIMPLIIILTMNKTGYNHELFRFDWTAYWIALVCSMALLIFLNELTNFILCNTKLKKMIKSRQN